MRRGVAALGVGLFVGACASPTLSSSDALDQVERSMARADIKAESVRLLESEAADSYRAVARVGGGKITVTLDRRTGAYRRIEVTEEVVDDRQIRQLARQRNEEVVSRRRTRQVTTLAVGIVVLAAAGVVLARRARLRENRAAESERGSRT